MIISGMLKLHLDKENKTFWFELLNPQNVKFIPSSVSNLFYEKVEELEKKGWKEDKSHLK